MNMFLFRIEGALEERVEGFSHLSPAGINFMQTCKPQSTDGKQPRVVHAKSAQSVLQLPQGTLRYGGTLGA